MSRDRADGEVERRLEAWGKADQVPVRPEVQRELSATLKKSLEPVKPLPSNGVLALQFLGVFVACASGLIAVLDKTGLRLMTVTQMGAMAVLLGGGSIFVAAQLAARMAPGGKLISPMAPVLGLILAGIGGAMGMLFRWQMPPAFVAEGWPCAVLELGIAVPAAAIFWLLARRGALFASAGMGVALTALGVLLALTVDQAQCMFPQAPHLLVWHGGMAAALIGVGALAGSAMERRRR